MTSKRPTLKTISQLSGFAVTTVSRALNDGPEIGESTKEKVRQIAKEIGYVRNRSGVGLVTGKTNVITLVLSSDHDVVDEHTGHLIAAIAKALQGTLYHMNIVTFSEDLDRLDEVKHVVETRSTDALILNQIKPHDRRVAYLMDLKFPFVTYGRTAHPDAHPFFDFDNEAIGEQAAKSLMAKGRKKLLVISPPAELSYSQHLVKGIRKGIAGTDTTLEILAEATSHDTNEEVREALIKRFHQSCDIDGIVAPSTSSAVLSIAALEQNDKVLGTDIDLFAKEATPYLKYIRSDVMSVYEDLNMAGTFLAKAALQAINNPDAEPMQRLEQASPVFPHPNGGALQKEDKET